MPSFVTPKKNTAFEFYVGLFQQADTKLLQANPTLAAGDVRVSTDGAAFADITTLPVATPATSRSVKVSLSAAEMNGDNIVVQFVDAAGAQWCDTFVNIQTTATQIDDQALATAFTSILPDSVSTDGTRPSVNQALLMLLRLLTEASSVGTTLTVNKEDGTTPVMTFTLNSATDPTAITRTT